MPARTPHKAAPRRPWRGALADRRGGAAIEFAFVLPILLVLVFAVVVFSIYLATWLGVSQAAAEGARAAVAGLTAAERQSLAAQRVQAVIGAYSPLLNPAKVQVAYPAQASGFFSVTVTYPLAELGLARFAPVTAVPSVSPNRSSTVAVGGY